VPEPPVSAEDPSSVVEPAADPARWGRVDDDGTVWVKVGDAERAVGSYPGAGPDEALAYFARKYDELAGQVRLLEQRMATGGVSPKDASASIDRLRVAVTAASAVGDLAALSQRLDALSTTAAERQQRADARRARAREQAQVAKAALVAEAEALAGSTDWKKTGERLHTLLDEWKAAPRLERKVDDELWKRFSRARTAFEKSRRTHFAEVDVARAEAAQRKEKLIKEAEALASSTEWGPTAAQYRELMAQWKALPRARRDVEDGLWERFKTAQDAFFTARNAVLSARDSELKQNLEVKQRLLVEAEGLLPVKDPRSARSAMRAISERWEAAGHVPRVERDRVERRFKQVDEAIRAAEESAWKRSNPEALARAQAAVAQLQQSIDRLEAEAGAAREAGQTDKAQKAQDAATARRSWLVEAQRTLEEFS
jgi:hypothetical protein